MNAFQKIQNVLNSKLDKIQKVFEQDKKIYFSDALTDMFVARQLSQRIYNYDKTKEYSPAYYRYRLKKYGYTNIYHNYRLSGKLHNSFKFYMQNKQFFYESDAEYLKYLVNSNYSLIAAAFLFSDDEKQILVKNLVEYIKKQL